ncbi:unnamed protein product [Porites lobata]|uniref:Uncharacterized protein n=1 Tax=Porites lobata TaxID=104759 RepID=A0ABN8NPN8_9CNID|nr:unnamed protein product [Porites lobata]
MVTFFPRKKEQGHCFKIHGQERYLRGGLLLWTGDTLGSNCVSCFKEGVEYADTAWEQRKKLEERIALLPHDMMFFFQFRAEEFQARNLTDHLRICGMIEDPDNAPHVRDAL